MLSRLFMRITGLRTSGIEIPEGENEDARLPSFDAGVRGFTGLLVGFLAGMATWSLAFIIWWLV